MWLFDTIADYISPATKSPETESTAGELWYLERDNRLKYGSPAPFDWRRFAVPDGPDVITSDTVVFGKIPPAIISGTREKLVQAALSSGYRSIGRKCDATCCQWHYDGLSALAVNHIVNRQTLGVAHSYTFGITGEWSDRLVPSVSESMAALCQLLVDQHRLMFWTDPAAEVRCTRASIKLVLSKVHRFSFSRAFSAEMVMSPRILAQKTAIGAVLSQLENLVVDLKGELAELIASDDDDDQSTEKQRTTQTVTSLADTIGKIGRLNFGTVNRVVTDHSGALSQGKLSRSVFRKMVNDIRSKLEEEGYEHAETATAASSDFGTE